MFYLLKDNNIVLLHVIKAKIKFLSHQSEPKPVQSMRNMFLIVIYINFNFFSFI